MAHDDQFTATGPAFTGSGFPRSAFSSNASDMVYGVNVQGQRCGVYGESVRVSAGRESQVDGVGVYGFGENFGVMGNGNRGLAGVFGENNRGRVGVIGAVMRGGTGVFGASLDALGNPLQTFSELPGPEAGGSGIGVHGITGKGYGVLGEGEDNAGVVGRSINSVAVWGSVQGEGGYGVLGEGVDNAGVVGRSDSSVGVWGQSTNSVGVWGQGGDRGVLGSVNSDNPGALAGHFVGPVFIEGDLTVTGLKGAVVPHADGSHRLLCAIESPESWFEDFGEATLDSGKANVALDSDFATLVSIERDAYHVFLTPYGDTKGLYVAQRTASGFHVREQQGGASNARFAYRIVAKRKGVANDRLATVTLPLALSVETRPTDYRAEDTVSKPYSPRPR
jgi:hypothetical protein